MLKELFFDHVGNLHLIVNVVSHAKLSHIVNLLPLEIDILQCIFQVIQIHLLIYMQYW